MTDKPVKKHKAASGQQVVNDAVSDKLKIYYDEIARQEIPQRFLDLLDELNKAGGNQN